MAVVLLLRVIEAQVYNDYIHKIAIEVVVKLAIMY